MAVNRTQLFYSGILAVDTDFKTNSFIINGSFLSQWKFINDGATDMIVSWTGANNSKNEADVLAGKEIEFKSLQANKVAVRTASGSTSARIWAY